LLAAGLIAVGVLAWDAPVQARTDQLRTARHPAAPVAGATLSAQSSSTTCYAQSDHDAFASVISQNFEPSFDAYDTQAADDFVLTKPCRRPVIDVDGSYGEGVGTADSFNVTIYRAGKHGPGRVVRQFDSRGYVDTCHDGGCVEIDLGKKLKPGHWWISVQANLSFTQTSSTWGFWSNFTVRNTGAMWQNPADGFGTGCTSYTDVLTCFGDGAGIGGDLSFVIRTV
jgi:hypothetical protein